MEFNFDKNKKTEEVTPATVNSVELKELTDVKETKAPANTPELTNNASANSENVSKTEVKAEVKGNKKAVVTYIGNGVWRDANGKCWSRTDNANSDILSTRSYSMSEYEEREDLKFMVKYGEMKLSLV